jgi:hypothetical protein
MWSADNVNGQGKLKLGAALYTGSFEHAVFVKGEYRSAEGHTYHGIFTQMNLLQGTGQCHLACCGVVGGGCC